MIYAVYTEHENVKLVGIAKNKKDAKELLESTYKGFDKAWKHLTKKQVESLSYAQAMFFEAVIDQEDSYVL
nr:MAG TPA: hypothetical protein [Caudoviricetes sp.]